MFRIFGRHEIRYTGERVEIQLTGKDNSEGYPSYDFRIVLKETGKKIGYCDLRDGMNDSLYYAGQIGYRIQEAYRGHGYAYEAASLLLEYAKELGMESLIITCSPENTASRKTIEKLGGEFMEQVDVPCTHYLYRRGEPVKNIYVIHLKKDTCQ